MNTEALTDAYVKLLWSRLLRGVMLHNVLALEAGVPVLPEPATPEVMVASFVSTAAIMGEAMPENSRDFIDRLDVFVTKCCSLYENNLPGLVELAAIKGGWFASALKTEHTCIEVAHHGCRAKA